MKMFFTITIGLLFACSSDSRRTPASGDPGDPDDGDSLDGLVRTGGSSGVTRLHPSNARDGGSGELLADASEPLDGASEPLADASGPPDGGDAGAVDAGVELTREMFIGQWETVRSADPIPCGTIPVDPVYAELRRMFSIDNMYFLSTAWPPVLATFEGDVFVAILEPGPVVPGRMQYRLWLTSPDTMLGEYKTGSDCLALSGTRVMP